jgi:hypothetical protein
METGKWRRYFHSGNSEHHLRNFNKLCQLGDPYHSPNANRQPSNLPLRDQLRVFMSDLPPASAPVTGVTRSANHPACLANPQSAELYQRSMEIIELPATAQLLFRLVPTATIATPSTGTAWAQFPGAARSPAGGSRNLPGPLDLGTAWLRRVGASVFVGQGRARALLCSSCRCPPGLSPSKPDSLQTLSSL